jgi:hypothetical protein
VSDFDIAEALIASLERKADEVQKLLNALVDDMEKVPVEQRSDPKFARRFMELRRKQGNLVHQLALTRSTMKQSGRA